MTKTAAYVAVKMHNFMESARLEGITFSDKDFPPKPEGTQQAEKALLIEKYANDTSPTQDSVKAKANRDDPYTYKGTEVLINRFNIIEPEELEQAELEFSILAVSELTFIEPPYSFQTYCNLHQALFGDVFEWAGKIRSIDIAKGGTHFCASAFIEKEANKIFENLKKENYLTELDKNQFSAKLAEYYCEINALHPFREGNGRAQRLLFEQIAINAGYNLNFSGVAVAEWIEANIHGFHCNYSYMESIFNRSISTPNSITS